MSLDKLSNILGAETIKKIYEDGLTEPVKESGKLLTDLVKALRLFTAPVQLLASYQDRLTKYLNKVEQSVPEENQMEAPAFISGPAIERLKYLEDSNYLTDLYLNLLKRAIDRERINEAHPAFIHIIDQLSPDEAMLLYILGQQSINFNYKKPLFKKDNGQFSHWGEPEVLLDTTPKEKLSLQEYFPIYIEHLQSLNLIYWGNKNENAIYADKIQTHTSVESIIELTAFGKLFVKACIPDQGFSI